jgi:hypothetical protein
MNIFTLGMWSFDAMKTLSTADGGMMYIKNFHKRIEAEEGLYLGLPVKSKSGLDSSSDSTALVLSDKTFWISFALVLRECLSTSQKIIFAPESTIALPMDGKEIAGTIISSPLTKLNSLVFLTIKH